MLIKFSKMHGLGNDFMVIDGVRQSISLTPEQIKQWSDRHFGIGFDQLLLVEKAQSPQADFRYRIYNADGGEVEQCGNGARCFARFVKDQGLTNKQRIEVETLGGPLSLQIETNGQVTVNMGVPQFTPEAIPFVADSPATVYNLTIGEQTVQVAALALGNPHAVMQVEEVEKAPVQHLGPLLESHPRFPKRVNVGFMQIVDRSHMKLRVYERGAGETLACGSGACAAAVAAQRLGLVEQRVRVQLRGGELSIQWDGDDSPVWMTGPASHVYEGTIEA